MNQHQFHLWYVVIEHLFEEDKVKKNEQSVKKSIFTLKLIKKWQIKQKQTNQKKNIHRLYINNKKPDWRNNPIKLTEIFHKIDFGLNRLTKREKKKKKKLSARDKNCLTKMIECKHGQTYIPYNDNVIMTHRERAARLYLPFSLLLHYITYKSIHMA